jgi:hypothetical protein
MQSKQAASPSTFKVHQGLLQTRGHYPNRCDCIIQTTAAHVLLGQRLLPQQRLLLLPLLLSPCLSIIIRQLVHGYHINQLKHFDALNVSTVPASLFMAGFPTRLLMHGLAELQRCNCDACKEAQQ